LDSAALKRPHRHGKLSLSADAITVVVTVVAVLAVYIATLAPGLIGGVGVDTPRFQYLGHILGVPHNPGYPLYLVLSNLFSQLPIGTIAYRVNLLSAVCGALAVGILVRLLLDFGCGRWLAAAIALACAFAPIFWSQSIIAEVYTLHAALFLAVLLNLLRWGRTRRPANFFWAMAWFALALGHHTTIVTMVPAIVVYALWIDAKFVLRPRTIALTIGLLAVGLLQYALIIVRTRQGALFVEGAAPTITQALSAFTGRQFHGFLFAADLSTILFRRVPATARLITRELSPVGVLLLLPAVVWFARAYPPAATLFLLTAMGTLAFTLNYWSFDVPEFQIPLLLLFWIVIGVGLAAAIGRIRVRTPHLAWLSLAVLALPVWQFSTEYRARDLHRRTFDMRLFDRLFTEMPDRTVLLDENPEVSHLVLYKALGEEAARGKQLLLASPQVPHTSQAFSLFVRPSELATSLPASVDALERLWRDGYAIYGFDHATRQLRGHGLPFVPFQLLGPPLPEYLSALEPGSVVAIVMSAGASRGLVPTKAAPFAAIGATTRTFSQKTCYGAVGVVGRRSGALERSLFTDDRLELARGAPIGETSTLSPADLRLGCTGSSIQVNGREVARTIDGAAIAVFSRQGILGTARDVLARDRLKVPLDWRSRPMFQMTGVRDCRELQSAWQDTSPLVRQGQFLLRVPADTGVTMYLAQGTSRPPQILDSIEKPEVVVATYDPNVERGRHDLEAAYTADELTEPLRDAPFVSRVEVSASSLPPGVIASVELLVKGTVERTVARIRRSAPEQMPVLCRAEPAVPLFARDYTTAHYIVAQESHDRMFGDGWYPVERDGAGPFRWTRAEWAQLWVPLASVGSLLVRVEATSAIGPGESAEVGLRVNGLDQPRQEVRAGRDAYEWTVPADAWVSGNNRVEIGISSLVQLPEQSRDKRKLGLKVRQVGLVSLNADR
jgi:hypothetical protein